MHILDSITMAGYDHYYSVGSGYSAGVMVLCLHEERSTSGCLALSLISQLNVAGLVKQLLTRKKKCSMGTL
jgi:hypothetical protein